MFSGADDASKGSGLCENDIMLSAPSVKSKHSISKRFSDDVVILFVEVLFQAWYIAGDFAEGDTWETVVSLRSEPNVSVVVRMSPAIRTRKPLWTPL